VALILIVLIIKKHPILKHQKKYVFWAIALPILLSTFYLAGHTIYGNIHSITKGPIHWHADYQVWVCNERLDLINPKFPSNKIGSPLFHEHNDDRIHVEGTVQSYEDIDLDAFFQVIGGNLTSNSLKYKTANKMVDVATGNTCPDGKTAELAVFVNGKRIADPTTYMYAHEALVPPGDCVIIEFAANLGSTTSRICESWQAMEWDYNNFVAKRGDE
jgi:hypothetical protein